MEDFFIEISKSFSSKKESIKYVEPLINSIKDKIPLELEKYYNVLIAVTEAFNNAIIHGNKCDLNKQVTINIKANNDVIIVEINDEGEGFNPEKIDDPRKPENLMKDSGRGVFLIKELTDSCEFNHLPEGTTITMKFNVKHSSAE